MKSRAATWSGGALLIAACLSTMTHAEASSAGATIPTIDQVPALCRAAAERFRPITDADLTAARENLRAAVDRLDKRLKLDGDNGQAWRDYLHWDELQQLASGEEEAEPEAIDEIIARLTAGHAGLGLVWFVDVRRALDRYRTLIHAAGNERLQAAYEQLMKALADRIAAYAENPTTDEAQVIAGAMGQLADLGQAPDVLRALQHYFARPNLYLQVSKGVIANAVERPIDDVGPVHEWIFDTEVYGTGHTTGRVYVDLAPNKDHAVIDAVFLGFVRSENTGYNGPVQVLNRGNTGIGARKRIWINAEGVFSHPAVANAASKTKITGICTSLPHPLVFHIAWQQAQAQKPASEREGSRLAALRFNERFDRETAEPVGQLHEAYVERFRKPLLERKLFPRMLDFSTTKQSVHVVALQVDDAQLASPGAPPVLSGNPPIAMRMHESLINNSAAMALSGMTVRQGTLRANFEQLFGDLVDLPEVDEEGGPWGIVFPSTRPVLVSFDDGQLTITIRGRRFLEEDETYPGMDITAVYKIEKAEQGFRLARQGDVEVFPPGFDPESGKRLSGSQVVIRRQLQRRFDKVFQPELALDSGELLKQWPELGEVRLERLQADNGWLTVVGSTAAAAE